MTSLFVDEENELKINPQEEKPSREGPPVVLTGLQLPSAFASRAGAESLMGFGIQADEGGPRPLRPCWRR
ncbi:hypothetical protein JRQ81_012339 [Phrynocephalus forsythii]|uniref:Uncharacterized protein n=1 Tax=Phrynocephalus forsythii TaxID=171643 RepID=A0A9Q0X5Q8_9SAUR|nr:hypothetical protein JRQ81_012339 [Phrynocephalus forsythii]